MFNIILRFCKDMERFAMQIEILKKNGKNDETDCKITATPMDKMNSTNIARNSFPKQSHFQKCQFKSNIFK